LAVGEQERQRRTGAVAKDVDGAFERGIAPHLATHGGAPIDAFADIDRLGG
jgi:hypothetical protein